MIKFNLITGFLGSGKTTLLSNLLHELSAKKRIAVIQNEFAPSGIDGKELNRLNDDFKIVEINNGSVFCVCQLSNFVQNLLKLIEDYKPDFIFLEASGLADPISVVELLQTEELKDKVALDKSICLVDAPNFFRGLSSLVRFKHQIMVADKIIINKIDLFEGNLADIEIKLRELNPFAEIIQTSYAEIAWSDLVAFSEKNGASSKRYIGKTSGGQPDIKTCVLRTHDKIKPQALQAFIAELQSDCLRIKGYLNLIDGRVMSVHSVYDEVEFKELKNYTGPSELITFSKHLSVSSLRKIWKKHSN
jgi:G3E family GTPase